MLKFLRHPIDRTASVLPAVNSGSAKTSSTLDSGSIEPAPISRPRTLGLPHLVEVAPDLRTIGRMARLWGFSRPVICLLAYLALAYNGLWVGAVLAVVAVFLTAIPPLHDPMHHNLGLSKRANSIAISLIGALILESGHTLQATHLEHHRLYPSAADPEAWLESEPWWKVLAAGPTYRHNLACWAWQHRPLLRRWIAVEATASLAIITAAGVVGWKFPVLGVYVLLAVIGSWLFPIVSVTAVHDMGASNPLLQARTLRGAVLPRLALGATYHLEHHLYPAVPSRNLGALSRRLDPKLADLGVRPTRGF